MNLDYAQICQAVTDIAKKTAIYIQSEKAIIERHTNLETPDTKGKESTIRQNSLSHSNAKHYKL